MEESGWKPCRLALATPSPCPGPLRALPCSLRRTLEERDPETVLFQRGGAHPPSTDAASEAQSCPGTECPLFPRPDRGPGSLRAAWSRAPFTRLLSEGPPGPSCPVPCTTQGRPTWMRNKATGVSGHGTQVSIQPLVYDVLHDHILVRCSVTLTAKG